MTRDPGLQPERTALAWQRTGVAAFLVASGATVAAAHRGQPVDVIAALGALVMSAATTVPPRRRSVRSAYGRLVRAVVVVIAVAAAGVVLAVT